MLVHCTVLCMYSTAHRSTLRVSYLLYDSFNYLVALCQTRSETLSIKRSAAQPDKEQPQVTCSRRPHFQDKTHLEYLMTRVKNQRKSQVSVLVQMGWTAEPNIFFVLFVSWCKKENWTGLDSKCKKAPVPVSHPVLADCGVAWTKHLGPVERFGGGL